MHVVFIEKDGVKTRVDFDPGETVLQVAERNGIRINSYCEGFGICGGCHVIIPDPEKKLAPKTDEEDDTLDKSHGVEPNSRLACQVVLNDNCDGLVIHLI